MEPNQQQKILSFYELETKEVLGAPPPKLVTICNLALLFILLAAFLYGALVEFPITYQNRIEPAVAVKIDTGFIYLPPNIQQVQALFIQDRQWVAKNEVLAQFENEDGETRTLLAPSDGKVFFLQTPQKGQSLDAENPLFMLLHQPEIHQFYLPVSAENIDQIRIGQVASVFSSQFHAGYIHGKITSIVKKEDRLFALVHTEQSNASLDYSNLYVSITTGKKSLFTQLFSKLFNQ